MLDSPLWAEHLFRAKFNLKKLLGVFKVLFFYKEFVEALSRLFDQKTLGCQAGGPAQPPLPGPGGDGDGRKRDFLFSEVRAECLALVRQTEFQRYAHLLLKAFAVLEKAALKFSGLPS